MTRKRYTQRRAEMLLAQIIEAAGHEYVKGADTARAMRAADLLMTLELPGPFAVGLLRDDGEGDEEDAGASRSWSVADLRRFQFHVWSWVQTCLTAKKLSAEPVAMSGIAAAVARVDLTPIVDDRGNVRIRIRGKRSDVLGLQFAILLHVSGAHRLMKCDCGTVFVKTGRREFCSDRCQKRVYMAERRRALKRKGASHGKTTRTRRG